MEPTLDPVSSGGSSTADHLANAVVAFMKDESIPAEVKKKKINDILKLMEKDDPKEEPKKEEPKEENKTPDGDKDIASDKPDSEKDDKKYESLQKELTKVKDELKSYKLAEERSKLHAKVKELCVEEKLPDHLITEPFLEVLIESKSDESRKRLINSLKSVLTQESKPKSALPSGDQPKLTVDSLLSMLNKGK